ncbi:MAG: hypothetical protein OEY49_08630, partial [Candidatus Heimdallarchaeota archaeon]|nr:hypothetical protein [Candidatus Heimdallarchaeota archaeon]
KKDVTTWNTYLDACNDHYSELMNRVVPPKPLSKTEMEVIREDLSDQFTSMMRVVRSAKYV